MEALAPRDPLMEHPFELNSHPRHAYLHLLRIRAEFTPVQSKG